MAATPASRLQPSKIGCCQGPWIASRWSHVQIESQPAASAATAASRTSGHVVDWGQSWRPNRTAGIVRVAPSVVEVVRDRDHPQPERDSLLGPEGGDAVLIVLPVADGEGDDVIACLLDLVD